MTAKATTGITNLYLYNRFIDDELDTEILRYTIDQTNDLIAKKCARTFGSTTYKEWVEGNCQYLVLDNYPITSVRLVSSTTQNLFTVENTGNSLATVSSDEDGITLLSIDSSAVETETELLYATYTNVSDLVDAINLIAGWTAEVLSNQDDALTQLIRPMASGYALGENVYFVGPYMGADVRVSIESDSTLNSIGGGYFVGNVFVWYTAGYTLPICSESGGELTTAGNVPEALTLVANTIIKEVMNYRDEDGNMQNESIGDFNYTRHNITSAVDRHWKDLSLWARKSI